MIVGSLAPVFFAAFARLDGMKSDTGNAFSYAVKYISYFLMPVFIFLMASSNLVIEIIYGRTYLPASYYLELLMLGYLPLAFGQAVLSSFFNRNLGGSLSIAFCPSFMVTEKNGG